MSSHREAPEISKDPVADSTDVYAFVSPDKPDTVTLIANFIPLQKPDGGPNFYEFADDVLYEIHISNRGKSEADITYQFRFNTAIRNPNTFLYNTGPIESLDSVNFNRPQVYNVTRVTKNGREKLGNLMAVPPVNVGVRSTPDYEKLAEAAITRSKGHAFFAGQRADAFHVDLGSIFDLGALRPFNEAHVIKMPEMNGVNSVQAYNVHTIAIQVPINQVSKGGNKPSNPESPSSVIGVWATASRRKSRIWNQMRGTYVGTGPWKQVARLGNPLVNEVVIPMADKDNWNARPARRDRKFDKYVYQPELAKLLPVLYPGVFPNLEGYSKDRADLHAILHTGIPKGIVPGFSTYTGPRSADMLRLNLAIPPSEDPKDLGVIGGDPAGFPNGRRIKDDVVTIELRAIAGATIPLVDDTYTPDGAAAAVTDGTENTAPTRDTFPYLGEPFSGYLVMPPTAS